MTDDGQYHYEKHIQCELCGRATRGPLNDVGDVICDSCHQVLVTPKGTERIKQLQEMELRNKRQTKAQLEREISLLEDLLQHS